MADTMDIQTNERASSVWERAGRIAIGLSAAALFATVASIAINEEPATTDVNLQDRTPIHDTQSETPKSPSNTTTFFPMGIM